MLQRLLLWFHNKTNFLFARKIRILVRKSDKEISLFTSRIRKIVVTFEIGEYELPNIDIDCPDSIVCLDGAGCKFYLKAGTKRHGICIQRIYRVYFRNFNIRTLESDVEEALQHGVSKVKGS